MEMVGKLLFLNEYGKLETVNQRDCAEVSDGALTGASGAGVVPIVSFLTTFFTLTGENGLVPLFCLGGGVWASGKMVQATAATVGSGADPEKKAASSVA